MEEINAMKILTLNIGFYSDKHGPWDARKILIADAIRLADPDVVALQAVGSAAEIEGGKDQAVQLAESLSGYTTHFEPINDNQAMAFLSRMPILRSAKKELSRLCGHEDNFDRIVFYALVDSPLGDIHLFNAHFSWVDEQALHNVTETLPFLDSASGLKVLVGDFNQTPNMASIHKLHKAGWSDSFAALHPGEDGFTFEANDPAIRIDYAFVNDDLRDRVEAVEIIESFSDETRMSDHLALMVTLS
jgi:endonuclease/exonuclease/phosphatase family metal-dependent hydrolase